MTKRGAAGEYALIIGIITVGVILMTMALVVLLRDHWMDFF